MIKHFKSINKLKISIFIDKKKVPVGFLAIKKEKIFFEYTKEFLKLQLKISPFKLPLNAGIIQCSDSVFEGLFGVFNDSLPDGWGRLLIDRKLASIGIEHNLLTPLDRLRIVGTSGMGALIYEPIIENVENTKRINLDIIAKECALILNKNKEDYLDKLIKLGGSSTGARPKIIFNPSDKKNESWLIKFRAKYDEEEIGLIEYAYNLMAERSGIEIPEIKLFNSKNSLGFFGSKRFDLIDKRRIHMHTLSGLMHVDHKFPCIDYKTVMKVTNLLTRDHNQVKKIYRQCVFNVFSHNRDDHAKNFTFLMMGKGEWYVSPSYDLTFSYGPGGEHCTTVMGNGKNPGSNELLRLGIYSGIKEQECKKIIYEVKAGISNWKEIAKNLGIGLKKIRFIKEKIDKIR